MKMSYSHMLLLGFAFLYNFQGEEGITALQIEPSQQEETNFKAPEIFSLTGIPKPHTSKTFFN